MTEASRVSPGIESEVINRALHGLAEAMVTLRRDIHAHPELAWNEVRTSALVADVLTRAGLAPSSLPFGTGLVCDVVGVPDGPMVALRADLDALPIDDEKSAPYRSSTPGVAHACGHDVHIAADAPPTGYPGPGAVRTAPGPVTVHVDQSPGSRHTPTTSIQFSQRRNGDRKDETPPY